jgi:hypothetical protein
MLNTLAGLILVFGSEEAEEAALLLSFNHKTVRFVSGVVCLVAGILKILSPVAGNVPVVGDLVPALTGIAASFVLMLESGRHVLPDSRIADYVERIAALLGRNRKLCGLVSLSAAALHLVFYPIIFL